MVVTIGEGQTLLQRADKVGQYVGMTAGQPAAPVRGHEPVGQLQRQRHDRRVHARQDGGRTKGRLRQHRQHLGGAGGLLLGNRVRIPGIVFIGSGKIAYGKLSQALDYGALTLQIQGDFDDACAASARSPIGWAST